MKKIKFRILKDNCDDLGFVEESMLAWAITFDEFKQWIYMIIKEEDINSLPSFVFDLADATNEQKFGTMPNVGFTPYWNKTASESNALDGISFLRGLDDDPVDYDRHISKHVAEEALRKNPHILERFKDTFPFIEVPTL